MEKVFTKQGKLNIHNNYYNAITLSKSYLILDATNKSSIYCAEHKTKRIKRKITKNYTIRLDGFVCDISKIEGIKFHMEGK